MSVYYFVRAAVAINYVNKATTTARLKVSRTCRTFMMIYYNIFLDSAASAWVGSLR